MTFSYTDLRFADIQMLRYRVSGFGTLSLRQKKLVYYLSEAALAGRDILWHQNCRFNLPIRHLLEAVYTQYQGPRTTDDFRQFVVYLRRVWFSNGIHHHYACDKFQPGFRREFLEEALRAIHYVPAGDSPIDGARHSVSELLDVIFLPELMAKRVNQAEGADLLLTSAMNYYAPGITQREAEDFYNAMKRPDDPRPVMYGMNSRLERDADGRLFENTWRSGGLYGPIIDRIVRWLALARDVAENDPQRQVITTLIDFYRTGNLRTFDQYTIQWVGQTEGDIDFTNGFTEVYGDPLGLKASWEGYVNLRDSRATARTELLSRNAQWFEDHSPVAPQFKKAECRGVSAKVVTAAILGGDLYPSSAIGINLPNSNWVRQEHGSKSVTIGNLTEAYARAARGNGFRQEFYHPAALAEFAEAQDCPDTPGGSGQSDAPALSDLLDDLHTDLHECLGHGSGQLLPGVDPDALRAYGSTIEEARADLFALYYIADPKLVELGLVPDGEAYRRQYYGYLLNGLITQLVRIEPGRQLEEAHMRNRALIAHWLLAHSGGAMALTQRDSRTHLLITDYPALRRLVGTLLAEVQRIKSEGDYEAARQLVEQYGVRVDPALHAEVLRRYRALDLTPYKGFINPRYTPQYDADGHIADVLIDYTETYDEQMLRYGRNT